MRLSKDGQQMQIWLQRWGVTAEQYAIDNKGVPKTPSFLTALEEVIAYDKVTKLATPVFDIVYTDGDSHFDIGFKTVPRGYKYVVSVYSNLSPLTLMSSQTVTLDLPIEPFVQSTHVLHFTGFNNTSYNGLKYVNVIASPTEEDDANYNDSSAEYHKFTFHYNQPS